MKGNYYETILQINDRKYTKSEDTEFSYYLPVFDGCIEELSFTFFSSNKVEMTLHPLELKEHYLNQEKIGEVEYSTTVTLFR